MWQWGANFDVHVTLCREDGCSWCQLSNASSTRGVFKQKFEQSDSRKENKTWARKQRQDG